MKLLLLSWPCQLFSLEFVLPLLLYLFIYTISLSISAYNWRSGNPSRTTKNPQPMTDNTATANDRQYSHSQWQAMQLQPMTVRPHPLLHPIRDHLSAFTHTYKLLSTNHRSKAYNRSIYYTRHMYILNHTNNMFKNISVSKNWKWEYLNAY